MNQTGQIERADGISARELTLWTIAIFGFAATVRFVVLGQIGSHLEFDLPVGDARVNQLWARRLVESGWSGDGAYPYAPLYPYFLSVINFIAGESLPYVRAIQIVLSSLSCVLLAQVAWRYFSRSTGILVGAALALHPGLIFSSLVLEPTTLEVLLLCAALSYMGDLDLRARWGAGLGLGLAIGALILTQESAFLIALVVFVWLMRLPSRPRNVRLACAGTFVAGIIVVLLPAVVRNEIVAGELQLSSSYAAYEVYVGNNPTADGTNALADASAVTTAAVARMLGHAPDRDELSGFYRSEVVSFIGSDPLRWIGLIGHKLMLWLNTVELQDSQQAIIYSGYSRLLDLSGRVLRMGILWPLALLGAFVVWPMRERLWPYYGIVGANLLIALFTFASGQRRLSIVPVVILMATVGVTGLRSFFGSRSRGAVFGGLAALALAVVVTNWPVLDPRWVQSVTYRQWGDGLAGVEQIDPALVRYERAIKLDPDNAVALHNGAMMRARRHEPGVAALYLREALRAVPTYADAHFSLARVLIDAYDPVGAIESYRNGLELDPNRAQAHYDLSRLLYEQGDAVEAQEHFQRAKELNAPSP